MNHLTPVTVVGAGPAGSECAWQLAKRGIPVRLIDMKPAKMTPAHTSPYFSELVCSNSLRSDELANAVGLLKAEMRALGSLFLESADVNRVPAGGALAVDRVGFARYITDKLTSRDNIEIVSEEVTAIPEGEVVIASGPLSSDAIADRIQMLCGQEGLHFYDAVAPIVTLESVDMSSAFFASRYDKGTADYVNCPMDKDEYLAFVSELAKAKEAPIHGFDDGAVFEGCMPVEVMARRGVDTLRYGVMHRNTLLNSPRLLDRYYRLKSDSRISFAGQMTGVEGYVESAASGMLVGIETAARILGLPPADFPQETAIGALAQYISSGSVGDFQPMNINFGLITPLGYRVKGKRNKNAEISARSLRWIGNMIEERKGELFS